MIKEIFKTRLYLNDFLCGIFFLRGKILLKLEFQQYKNIYDLIVSQMTPNILEKYYIFFWSEGETQCHRTAQIKPA